MKLLDQWFQDVLFYNGSLILNILLPRVRYIY